MVNVHMIAWSPTAIASAISQKIAVKIGMKKNCVSQTFVRLFVLRFQVTVTAHVMRRPVQLGAALTMDQWHVL